MLSLFLSGGFSALWHALMTRWFGKKKDYETQEAEHARDQAQAGEKAFSAPDTGKSDVIADFRLHDDRQ